MHRPAPPFYSRATVGMALVACAFALSPEAATGATIELQLTPAGAFRPSDGREMVVDAWRIDAAIASRVIDRFAARRTPLVIDYEHQTLHKEENGQPAPAAGWVQSIHWRESQGLFATVELTERARALIAAREYRFFSPVFSFDANTGDVLEIHMGALTNHPAIDGMQPLELRAAATFRTASQENDSMNPLLAAVLAALALPAGTTEPQAIAALSALGPVQERLDALAKLRTALGVAETADTTALVTACTALRANQVDPAKFVPLSVVEELKGQLAALTAQVTKGEVDKLVEEALADGRLLPAQEQWARELGASNRAALSSYLEVAQPIAALTQTQTKGRAPESKGEHGLTAEELAVCSATGLTPEQFAKAKSA